MLYIIHPKPGARLHYITKLVFGTILKVQYQFASEKPAMLDGDSLIQYGGPKESKTHGYIPACGLLDDDFGLQKVSLPNEQGIQGDLLAGAFWWATGYAYQSEPRYDTHERYHYALYPHIQQGLHRKPWVHIFATAIAQIANIPLPPPAQQAPHITFDIDHPWMFRQKPLGVTLGSAAKKLIAADFKSLKDQYQAIFQEKDPNYTFDTIFDLAPAERSTIFFLIERRHIFDTRHTWKNKAYRKLIQDIHQRGYTIGIHPSYTTFLNEASIKEETEHLAAIIGEPVLHSRMHFLKYRQPETFRALLKAGIRHDYSTGFYHDIGFAYGMAVPFPWFDLENNEETALSLHPTHAMDRTFLSYLQTTPKEALDQVADLSDSIQNVSGELCLLFHNESLSQYGEWYGWEPSIRELLLKYGAQ